MAKANLFLKLYLLAGRIFYRLKVEEVENIPAAGGCVVACNLVAPIVDGLTGAVVLLRRPDTFAFGGRGLPAVGLLGKVLGGQRKEGKELPILAAYKARGISAGELLKALTLLREGKPIALAAEGELTWDGQLQYPLAPGAAWKSLRAHVPVVPVVSKGGYDIMPRWARLPKLTGRVTIRAGKPFYVSDGPATRVTNEMIAAAGRRIYDESAALLAR